MNFEEKVARALLNINAVGFVKGVPVRFKSGILSPVYVDNRKIPSFPKYWKIILNGKKDLIRKKKIRFDIIAGVESGGIPHSATLGFLLNKPSVFVRKQTKEHGNKKRVEGGDVKGKTVVLVEDLVTLGSSSLSSVQALRNEGAKVKDCLAIVSYGFPEAKEAFKKSRVRLHTLTPFSTILREAITMRKCTKEQAQRVREWYQDPWAWTKKNKKN
ncbi:MAG TPA: orotate phosphoribosyltransferase [Candidatus Paceibacterota bacterium]